MYFSVHKCGMPCPEKDSCTNQRASEAPLQSSKKFCMLKVGWFQGRLLDSKTSIQSSPHINIHSVSVISVCIPQEQFNMKQKIFTVTLSVFRDVCFSSWTEVLTLCLQSLANI